jgi:proline iminopeptidase
VLKALVAIAALAATSAHADQVRHDVVVDGVRIAYWTSRDIKPTEVPIVFLHGGPGYNSYSFRRTAGPALEGDATVVYMDERGSGASERPLSKDRRSAAAIVRTCSSLRAVARVSAHQP